jgi:membrane protein
LRRAYGVKFCAPFWEYRQGSILMIVGAVMILIPAFAFTVLLSWLQHAIEQLLPFSAGRQHARHLRGAGGDDVP